MPVGLKKTNVCSKDCMSGLVYIAYFANEFDATNAFNHTNVDLHNAGSNVYLLADSPLTFSSVPSGPYSEVRKSPWFFRSLKI